MTPISDVFMLSIDSQLDYELLKNICRTGHSRVPVYEEVEVMCPETVGAGGDLAGKGNVEPIGRVMKVKKIVGILLVKQCVLLDPNGRSMLLFLYAALILMLWADAVPLRKIPLNKVPFVPSNEPLLGILDKFQEGRSHMAIVSRFSVDKVSSPFRICDGPNSNINISSMKAASVKKAVKRGLTQRLRQRVGIGESSDEDDDGSKKLKCEGEGEIADTDGEATLKGDGILEKDYANSGRGDMRRREKGGRNKARQRRSERVRDVEMGVMTDQEGCDRGDKEKSGTDKGGKESKSRRTSFQLIVPSLGMMSAGGLEQSMPADAVLAKEGAEEVCALPFRVTVLTVMCLVLAKL
jgi:metal transporter CNNM